MIPQIELVEKVLSYDPTADVEALKLAYAFSMKAHGAQKRDSGDLYFSHPLEVASILSDMKLDDATIITALLHDTIEDTSTTLDEIRKFFGDEIANLVNGVTKLTKLELQSDSTKQAENFRKLVLAMSNDLRVLLVKLADRIHNMRTLSYVSSEEKRKRIARETLEIYAPLAERIGIHHFKDELSDLAFKELNREERESILKRLHFFEQEGGSNVVKNVIAEMQEVFNRNNLKAQISGRLKTPYSIWRKIRRKNVTFEQLSDVMAFRVVVETLPECYQALGIVHGSYSVIPSRFKDFISTPKPNKYQSIHTSVIGPFKQRVEIQIKTQDMHQIAEYGVAAHWQYKQGIKQTRIDYPWLKSLLEILEYASDPEEFLEHTKLEMFQDQVFCFTPAGDLIPLPLGATPIDFAYAIHSEIGNRCVGAKINGRMVPLRTPLHNGDQIEITTSHSQIPSANWERFVVTGKARAHIRKFVRTQQRVNYIESGRLNLQKLFNNEKLEFSEKLLDIALDKLQISTTDDLLFLIGEGQLSSYEVFKYLHPEFHTKNPVFIQDIIRHSKKTREKEAFISIKGLIPNMEIHYARCCHPLPGDHITGIVMTGTGITIHTFDCEHLKNYAKEPERWIDVEWDQNEEISYHVGRLTITAINQISSLANITTIMSKHNANIINLKIVHRTDSFFKFIIDLEVQNIEHLENVIAHLRTHSIINSVDRTRG